MLGYVWVLYVYGRAEGAWHGGWTKEPRDDETWKIKSLQKLRMEVGER